jgi:hypothetical protein
MNSQILKLAQKSGATVNQGFDGTKNFVYGITMSPEELDKFAQLIVRECLETMRLVPYETDREFGDEVVYQEAVKKHFGVEE